MCVPPRQGAPTVSSSRNTAFGAVNSAIIACRLNEHRTLLILAGDIGATNARFGCYDGGDRVGVMELPTRRAAGANALLENALAALPRGRIESCCLAVAGPVLCRDGDVFVRLTNAQLTFSRQGVAAAVGTPNALLVNDMVAIGTAADQLAGDRFEALDAASRPRVGGVKGVLAAGTGLGMGVVVDGRCLASEGGHARIAPAGAFERELVAFTESELADQGGVVTWEHYLSGAGVPTLHRAVCAVWGTAAPTLAAEEIVRRGLDGADPICETTARAWAGMFATAAGGLAVTALTFGGIYLAGSVASALAPLLREAHFRRRFQEAAQADFLADIPLFLTVDAHIGLEGAHLLARAEVA